MSLDTSTLTTTAIPNIAARTVEQAAIQLYAAKKAAYEAFWAARSSVPVLEWMDSNHICMGRRSEFQGFNFVV